MLLCRQVSAGKANFERPMLEERLERGVIKNIREEPSDIRVV